MSECIWGDSNILESNTTNDLVPQIVQRADRVFLWVYLAVRASTERLKAGGSLQSLQKCLQDFPRDLENYFKTMIYQRISSTWREGSEIAKALKIATLLADSQKDIAKGAQPEISSRSFLNYWFLCTPEGLDSEEFAFQRPISNVSESKTRSMVQQTEAYIRHSTSDLLSFVKQ